MADADSTGLQAQGAEQQAAGIARNGKDVCDTASQRLQDRAREQVERHETQEQESQRSDCNVSYTDNGSRTLRGDGELQATYEFEREGGYHRRRTKEYEPGEWWTVEPDVGRVAYGIPHRVDRIRCLGNAVVPQQFYPIFKAIAEIEKC